MKACSELFISLAALSHWASAFQTSSGSSAQQLIVQCGLWCQSLWPLLWAESLVTRSLLIMCVLSRKRNQKKIKYIYIFICKKEEGKEWERERERWPWRWSSTCSPQKKISFWPVAYLNLVESVSLSFIHKGVETTKSLKHLLYLYNTRLLNSNRVFSCVLLCSHSKWPLIKTFPCTTRVCVSLWG